jgi:hypothetical protein
MWLELIEASLFEKLFIFPNCVRCKLNATQRTAIVVFFHENFFTVT